MGRRQHTMIAVLRDSTDKERVEICTATHLALGLCYQFVDFTYTDRLGNPTCISNQCHLPKTNK